MGSVMKIVLVSAIVCLGLIAVNNRFRIPLVAPAAEPTGGK